MVVKIVTGAPVQGAVVVAEVPTTHRPKDGQQQQRSKVLCFPIGVGGNVNGIGSTVDPALATQLLLQNLTTSVGLGPDWWPGGLTQALQTSALPQGGATDGVLLATSPSLLEM